MRSIERRYKKFYRKNPLAGDYVILLQAVTGMKFSQRVISRFFEQIMPRNDYPESEKRNLISQLMLATMKYVSRSDKKGIKNAPGDVKSLK